MTVETKISADADLQDLDWRALLRPYAGGNTWRAIGELASTALPFLALMAALIYSLDHSIWLACLLYIPAAGFIVRLFIIQHDCGHHSFFKSRRANDIMGRVLSLVTLTPYNYWRFKHASHHASAANLDRRGTGDIWTLTVSEYGALSRPRKLLYHLYRHPAFLFGIAPAFQFWIMQRIPDGEALRRRTFVVSILGTNVALAVLWGVLWATFGLTNAALAFFPPAALAASAGMWLFYVQHNFEGVYWEKGEKWNSMAAALKGSSLYDLPRIGHWITCNIGYHHIHHLWSRIPGYNLRRCFRETPALHAVRTVTLLESLRCAHLRLWDEQKRKLATMREVRRARSAPTSAA